MTWDLATILTLLVFVSGLLWLLDHWLFAPKRKAALAQFEAGLTEMQRINLTPADREKYLQPNTIIDLARSLFPVFLIVLLLRSFLVEPFRIPSSSMMPTLLIGDFILVNKFTYGIRLPVLNEKVLEIDKPQRGDVVVFRYPENPTIPFIKRVVAVGGDKVQYQEANKALYVNNELITHEVLGTFRGVGSGSDMTGREERMEKLFERRHRILVSLNEQNPAPYTEMIIPAGKYFVLGDNRDNSRDSRYWGLVSDEHLIGKAFLIWMNWDWANGGIAWERLGTAIE